MKSLVGNYKNLNYKDFSIKITLEGNAYNNTMHIPSRVSLMNIYLSDTSI